MKMTLRCALAAIVLMSGLGASVIAGPPEDAAAGDKGDYATALRLFRSPNKAIAMPNIISGS